jgi:hypothetical protein
MTTTSGTPGDRQCSKTGLQLEPASGQRIWRIAKTSYGPLNPQERKAQSHRRDWGRYDVLGHRTIYGASPAVASYAESLAAQRLRFTREGPALTELFDDLDPDDQTSLLEAVERDWAERNHMAPGTVAAGWRLERRLYELRLPRNGWFVAIERAESITAVSAALKSELGDLGLDQLSVGDLRSEHRVLTTTIADWVWHQTLDDGTKPHGIRFGSKHDSTWSCWAIWLRAVDDGKRLSAELTKSDKGAHILDCEHNPEMARVMKLFKIRCF